MGLSHMPESNLNKPARNHPQRKQFASGQKAWVFEHPLPITAGALRDRQRPREHIRTTARGNQTAGGRNGGAAASAGASSKRGVA
jgi:hypothetical protein